MPIISSWLAKEFSLLRKVLIPLLFFSKSECCRGVSSVLPAERLPLFCGLRHADREGRNLFTSYFNNIPNFKIALVRSVQIERIVIF